jgi:hypothetical protein
MSRVVTVEVEIEANNAPSLYWAQEVAYVLGLLEALDTRRSDYARQVLLEVLCFVESALAQSTFEDEDSQLGPWIGGTPT